MGEDRRSVTSGRAGTPVPGAKAPQRFLYFLVFLRLGTEGTTEIVKNCGPRYSSHCDTAPKCLASGLFAATSSGRIGWLQWRSSRPSISASTRYFAAGIEGHRWCDSKRL